MGGGTNRTVGVGYVASMMMESDRRVRKEKNEKHGK